MDLSLLFANTFLLRIPLPGPFARFGHLHAKPAVRARAEEYGAALAGYDVMALCEVFRPEDLEAMLSVWSGPAPDVVTGPGWPSRTARASSGLVTLTAGLSAHPAASEVFADQGSRLRDSDAWSSKGVLVTTVGLPGATDLEIVSTHLIAGGDIGNTERHLAATEAVRFDQVDAVIAAAEEAHGPGNATILVGDFNVQAGTSAGDRLHEMMAAAGYRDLWLDHGLGPGWTCDAVALGHPLTAPASDDDRFCADPAGDEPDAERIDYAFLRVGQDEPAVKVRALRRRVFRRTPERPEADVMPYLSDHVALHLELTID